MYRIGISKDIHRLVEGRKLLLGGIHIPFPYGEEAHSDGDVVYHAISEAILGALALGDLGRHFPTNDTKTKNLSSDVILNYVSQLMKQHNYSINNIDVQIILERPKLQEYIEKMRSNVALLVNTIKENVSIKVGTNEGMDASGKGEAVEAYAAVILKKNNSDIDGINK